MFHLLGKCANLCQPIQRHILKEKFCLLSPPWKHQIYRRFGRRMFLRNFDILHKSTVHYNVEEHWRFFVCFFFGRIPQSLY